MTRQFLIISFLCLLLSSPALAATGENYSVFLYGDGLQAGHASGGSYGTSFALGPSSTAAAYGGGYNASIGLFSVPPPVPAPVVQQTVAQPSYSGGGGGGGGGTMPPRENIKGAVETSDSRFLNNVAQGQTVSYETRNNLSITHLTLHFAEFSEIVRINIRQFKEKPESIPSITTPYKYFYIEHNGLDGADQHVLEFKISEEWLDEHDVEAADVVLYRLESNAWKRYDAQNTGRRDGHYFYQVTLPGFSYIAIGVVQPVAAAITAEPVVAAQTPAAAAQQQPGEAGAAAQDEQPSEIAMAAPSGGFPIWMIFLIIAGLITVGVVGAQQYVHHAHNTNASARQQPHESHAQQPGAQPAAQQSAQQAMPQQETHASLQLGPNDSIIERVPEHDPAHAVHQYILQMRAKGAPEEEIRKRLLAVGWDPLIVDMEMMRK